MAENGKQKPKNGKLIVDFNGKLWYTRHISNREEVLINGKIKHQSLKRQYRYPNDNE